MVRDEKMQLHLKKRVATYCQEVLCPGKAAYILPVLAMCVYLHFSGLSVDNDACLE